MLSLGGPSPDYVLDLAFEQLNILIVRDFRVSSVVLSFSIIAMVVEDIELPHRVDAPQADLCGLGT